MLNFDKGEIVICSVETKQGGKLKDPDSLQISIYKPGNILDINLVGMSRDSEGEWHYDYDTTDKPLGEYRARIKLVFGSRIKFVDGGFCLQ